jgi:endonuclease-3
MPTLAQPRHREIREVHRWLRSHYGSPPRRSDRREVLDVLIATVLSQNTTRANSTRAFASLKTRFPDWDAVRQAPIPAIRRSIRQGGLGQVKAVRIRAILREIFKQRGETSLEHLRCASSARIKRVLAELPGVGPKTVSCVLLFALGRPDFPVDTHVNRVARRLGWVVAGSSPEATYENLNPRIPDDIVYELHVLMVTHGRQLCPSRRPRCSECPLCVRCASGQGSRA